MNGEVSLEQDAIEFHKRDVHSQFGEDGILEHLLRRLGRWDAPEQAPLWCVEFGAWDGVHLSNTRRLIVEQGAHGVLIESDPARYADLEKNVAGNDRVTTMRRAVGWIGDERLDEILDLTACPPTPDVVSIDIDGLEHLVWRHFKRHRPRIIVVEYNPTIPYRHEFVPPPDGSERTGASLVSMDLLGRSKQYRLVAVTEVNAIFLDEALADAAQIPERSIEELTRGLPDFRTFLFQTPEGRFEICGNFTVMWNEIPIPPRLLQPLPWWARGHADRGGSVRRAALGWLRRRYRKQFDRFLTKRARQYMSPRLRR